MISKRGSGSGRYIETQTKRTKAGTFIRGAFDRQPRIPSCVCTSRWWWCILCVCVPLSLSWAGRASDCGKSRSPLRCHSQRDTPRRCRNQQRGGQSGRLPSECPETTPAWIRRYNPGQVTAHPYACPRPHPDSLRPVAVRWVIASRAGPQPRSLSIYLPPLLPFVRISPSPLLSSSRKMLPSPFFPPFPPSSRSLLTSFFSQQTRLRVQHSRPHPPSTTF